MQLVEPAERDLWEAVAEGVAPRARRRPSEWARENIVLSSRMTARPGPFSPRWKPWQSYVMDYHYDHPEKLGFIVVKPSQVGLTLANLVVMLCLAATDPGPMLYVTTDAAKASNFASEHLRPMIRGNAALAELFDAADGEGRELVNRLQYKGGTIVFAGAGSESAMISEPQRYGFIDEYQMSSENFPAASGDLMTTVLGRFPSYKDRSFLWIFGHPRFPREDIDLKFRTLSDQHEWVFDCPHCRETVWPSWELVHFERSQLLLDGTSRPDPRSAVLRCRSCGRAISDAERTRAAQAVADGGTARAATKLDPAEARAREYGGLAIHRLCDPQAELRELAAQVVACTSDAERQSAYNKLLGQTYTPAGAVVTVETVEKRLAAVQQIVLPGTERGVQIVTAGIDVQAPESNPNFYTTVCGWSTDGHCHAVAMQVVQGWTALFDWLRSFRVSRGGGDGRHSEWLGIESVGIDCGAWTGQVLDHCRRRLDSAATGARVQLVPVRFQSHVKSTHPATRWPEHKSYDPQRPHLGLIEAYDLHRHTWVDRMMRRWSDGRITVLCVAPPDLRGHITGNVLRPKKVLHTWEDGELEWTAEHRDDWAMALAYAEVVASVKHGLDRLHERLTPVTPGPSPRAVAPSRFNGRSLFRS